MLVGGLNFWLKQGEQIYEPRLLDKVRTLLNSGELQLFAPPQDSQDPTAKATGITVWQFPEWFVSQDMEDQKTDLTTRSRLLVHRKSLIRGKFIDQDKHKRTVVPVRFVRACRRGHIVSIEASVCFTEARNVSRSAGGMPLCMRWLNSWADAMIPRI